MYTTALQWKKSPARPDCLQEESTFIADSQYKKYSLCNLTLTEESYLYSKRSLGLGDKMLQSHFVVNNVEHFRANNL